ncbi:uncharacterized protein LOC125536195 isoform X2 [Triticum urartu]|uniref:uncharacterized protein LOC125536195 isoform X2 n=1 Tax=Triticum urartu TaxID=4572 RepID=UPI0020436EB2|nr:uncharacterized protein LOC125536195 isoform X2 [Triticum urartu]
MRPSLTNTQSTTMPGCGYCLIDQGSTATAGPSTPWRQHQNPSRYCSPLSPLLISFLVRLCVLDALLHLFSSLHQSNSTGKKKHLHTYYRMFKLEDVAMEYGSMR